jgi:hypothetical protein
MKYPAPTMPEYFGQIELPREKVNLAGQTRALRGPAQPGGVPRSAASMSAAIALKSVGFSTRAPFKNMVGVP